MTTEIEEEEGSGLAPTLLIGAVTGIALGIMFGLLLGNIVVGVVLGILMGGVAGLGTAAADEP